jgi:4'-phosphopantetheinyl transferase
VDIYAINISSKLDRDLYNKFLSVVDDDKRRKINRFKNSNDSIRTLIADILIRSIVRTKFLVSNEEITYEYNCYGKPKLKYKEEFHFNVSHSGDWVVAAVDNSPVGIDIEHITPIDDYTSIAQKFFNESEYNWLLSQSHEKRLESFYKLWTLKESYIKTIGAGLSISLKSFCIVFDKENTIFVKRNSSQIKKTPFQTYTINKNYALAAYSENDNFISSLSFTDYDQLYNKIFT